MGTNQTTANNQLKLILNATNWANIADNTATSPITQVWISLHTADPGATGNQTTNEIAYTSYARIAVARTTGGWTASTAASSSPVATITFPLGSGGSGTASYWGIGMSSTGAGTLLWSGTVSPNIVCGSGVTPQLTTASSIAIS